MLRSLLASASIPTANDDCHSHGSQVPHSLQPDARVACSRQRFMLMRRHITWSRSEGAGLADQALLKKPKALASSDDSNFVANITVFRGLKALRHLEKGASNQPHKIGQSRRHALKKFANEIVHVKHGECVEALVVCLCVLERTTTTIMQRNDETPVHFP
jgi:hypothetical protein